MHTPELLTTRPHSQAHSTQTRSFPKTLLKSFPPDTPSKPRKTGKFRRKASFHQRSPILPQFLPFSPRSLRSFLLLRPTENTRTRSKPRRRGLNPSRPPTRQPSKQAAPAHQTQCHMLRPRFDSAASAPRLPELRARRGP